MRLLPKVSTVSTNLGRWQPEEGDDADDLSRMPRVEVLMKCHLWTDPSHQQVRKMLAAPAMRVQVTASAESAKVLVSQGRASIEVIQREGGIPRLYASLPFMLVVIDTTDMTIEDMEMVKTMPGRSKTTTVPTIVFGEHAVVQAMVKTLLESLGSDWVGERRSYCVVPPEKDPQYKFAKRELITLIPHGHMCLKLTPVYLIQHAPSAVVGWLAIIGLMQWAWSSDGQQPDDEPITEWLYVVSHQHKLPVLLSTSLRNTPSVLFCPWELHDTMQDIGAKLAEHVRTTEGQRSIDWKDMHRKSELCSPLWDERPDDEAEHEEPEIPLKDQGRITRDREPGGFDWAPPQPEDLGTESIDEQEDPEDRPLRAKPRTRVSDPSQTKTRVSDPSQTKTRVSDPSQPKTGVSDPSPFKEPPPRKPRQPKDTSSPKTPKGKEADKRQREVDEAEPRFKVTKKGTATDLSRRLGMGLAKPSSQ